MDYMFLIYSNEAQMAQMTDEERRTTISKHWAIKDEATSLGVLKGANRLGGSCRARPAASDPGPSGRLCSGGQACCCCEWLRPRPQLSRYSGRRRAGSSRR